MVIEAASSSIMHCKTGRIVSFACVINQPTHFQLVHPTLCFTDIVASKSDLVGKPILVNVTQF